jgi:hypothetical protein
VPARIDSRRADTQIVDSDTTRLEPQRTRLGFSTKGWFLALTGLAVGYGIGYPMQIRFGGHATGPEAVAFIFVALLGLIVGIALTIVSLAIAPARAYWCYAAAVAIVAWATAVSGGTTLFMLEPADDAVLTLTAWSAVVLFAITPFVKPRPLD